MTDRRFHRTLRPLPVARPQPATTGRTLRPMAATAPAPAADASAPEVAIPLTRLRARAGRAPAVVVDAEVPLRHETETPLERVVRVFCDGLA